MVIFSSISFQHLQTRHPIFLLLYWIFILFVADHKLGNTFIRFYDAANLSLVCWIFDNPSPALWQVCVSFMTFPLLLWPKLQKIIANVYRPFENVSNCTWFEFHFSLQFVSKIASLTVAGIKDGSSLREPIRLIFRRQLVRTEIMIIVDTLLNMHLLV